MPQTTTIPSAAPDSILLDCQRLDCSRVAIEFQVLAADWRSLRGLGALRDQLDRASVSIVLNIAEGVRGSASECAAVLDPLSARALLAATAHRRGRSLLVRIVQMLTRLIARQISGGLRSDEATV